MRAFIMDAVVHELEHSAGGDSPGRKVKVPLIRSKRPGSLRLTGDAVAKALLEEDLHALA